MDPLRKNALYLMANTVVISALGFVFWIVIARLYATEYGEIEANLKIGIAITIISSASLLSLIASAGFEIGLIRFLPWDNEARSKEMINSCIMISAVLSFILGIIFLFGLNIWAPDLVFLLGMPIGIVAFLLFIIIWTINGLLTSVFVARRGAKFVLIKDALIFGTLKIIIAVSLVSLAVLGIVSSFVIAMGIACAIGIFIFLPKLQSGYSLAVSLNKGVISEIFHFSIGNHIATLFSTAPYLLLPLIITNVISPTITAYFYIALTISILLSKSSLSIATSLFAEGSRDEKRFFIDLKKSLVFAFTLLSPLIIIFLIFGDKILMLFGAEYAENGFAILQLLVLSTIPVIINTFYITMKRIQKRVKEIIGLRAFEAFGILGLGIPLMATMGIIGLAWSILITRLIITIVLLPNFIKEIIRNK